jgi:hypothetical protein
MPRLIGATLVLFVFAQLFAQQSDVDGYMQVQKAKAEVASCQKMLEESVALGSIPLHFLTYRELDRHATELTHCGFVFGMTGDSDSANNAGNESDRYDATASTHMEKYLKAKGLWNEFLKQDCRMESSTCGVK